MADKIEDEGELAALRAELAVAVARLDGLEGPDGQEIRAQRVVVVDEEGTERVVLSGRLATGSVLVRTPGPDGMTTGAELYAAEDPFGGESDVGVVLWRDGNQVAAWTEETDRAELAAREREVALRGVPRRRLVLRVLRAGWEWTANYVRRGLGHR